MLWCVVTSWQAPWHPVARNDLGSSSPDSGSSHLIGEMTVTVPSLLALGAVFPSEAKQEAGESRDARVGASAEPAPGTVGARSSPRAA